MASQPSDVDQIVRRALEAGATALKEVKKGMWGYGDAEPFSDPDGFRWQPTA